MFIGSEKFYFIPDLKADEVIIRKGRVLAEEFDNTDFTVKVRFLNGDAVQRFAVRDTEKEIHEAFEKFQEYRKAYWDARERIIPIERELKATYNRLYSEDMNIEFGELIAHLHDAQAVLAETEEKDVSTEESV